MNTETGQIYRGEKEIEAAIKRGEPIVEVSENVAQMVERGQSQQYAHVAIGGKLGRALRYGSFRGRRNS